MLWLALHFPHLPLEVFSRGASTPQPLVVAEKKGNRARLVSCNALAISCGVHIGMPVSAAQALVASLIVRWRDPATERDALAGLATWAGRFTPDVSLQPPDGLLLEISRCLRLHHGMDNLLGLVQSGIKALGYTVASACAPTPHGAWLLAKAGRAISPSTEERLEQELAGLPVALLQQPPETLTGLEMLGVETLADSLRLPRAGLARRFGKGLLDELDRVFGKQPEARAFFVPPPCFERKLELMAPVHEAEALLFAARRLLPELEGYLGLCLAGVQELEFLCRHEDAPDTVVTLGFVEPTREAERMLLQLREILGRIQLVAPVHTIILKASRILSLAALNGDLFQEATGQDDGNRLLERMRARLGGDAVHGISVAADHRPEQAWRSCAAGHGSEVPGNPHRPLWLLPRPVPCRDGSLVLKSPAERIESGWWDGHGVARDYYVAQDRDGARLWVFCERASGEWFVHGLFA
ncbi:MAG: DNA polymerase Y family protein [Sulfuricella sp.]|nr:DNA polymerase Y family protein [Sulfuricella sp.]